MRWNATIRRKVRAADHPDRIESLLDVAGLLEQERSYAAADSLLREALSGLTQSEKPDSAKIAEVRGRLEQLHDGTAKTTRPGGP